MLQKLQDMDLKGRRVFVRVDFNVPLKRQGDVWEVTDSSRIEAAIPSIRHILEQGGRCILASHLGRPKGKPNPDYSLEPIGQVLSGLLNKDVILTDRCTGDGARGLSHGLRNGEVLLLENLRFDVGEEANSTDFATRLLELCDTYVSDAFGTLHRAHASTSALPRMIPERGVGLLVQKELQYLQPLKEQPERPFVLVMGGAKVSDKIGVLEQFISKVDRIVIGGAMAYAFLRASGHSVGRSYCQGDQVRLATRLLKSAQARDVRVVLPCDHVVAHSMEDAHSSGVFEQIPEDQMALDIGPQTVAVFGEALQGARTIFWNGPMGVFEKPAFAKGTMAMAEQIASSEALKLAGGGDSAAAIAEAGLSDKFDFISTGGGATLEYLEGKELPGLKALQVRARESEE